MNERDILGVMACYNTRDRTRTTLERYRKTAQCDLLVVDDGSDDGTAEVLRDCGYPVIRHSRNRGLGAAIKTGIRHALDRGYAAVVIMAGNGKDDPAEIPRLLAPLLYEGCDYVQGSRFLAGGRAENLPFPRRVLIRAHAALIRALTGYPASDAINGFKAYRLSLFGPGGIDIWQDGLEGYELESYLHFRVLTSGCRVKEVPVSKTYPPPARGVRYSHVRPVIDWWPILKPLILLWLGLRR